MNDIEELNFNIDSSAVDEAIDKLGELEDIVLRLKDLGIVVTGLEEAMESSVTLQKGE